MLNHGKSFKNVVWKILQTRLSKRRWNAAFTAAVPTRANSVSNNAPVQLGSTLSLGTVRLSCAHVWVPWSVFCVNITISEAVVERLLLKFNLFTCYSFALLPWVFIPFAHQTAAIIRARWAGLPTVESNYRARLLWISSCRLAWVLYFLDAYFFYNQSHSRSSLIDVCCDKEVFLMFIYPKS